MRKEEFCEILGDINENHIQEARAARKAKKPTWQKWGVMAACFCFIAVIAIAGPDLFGSVHTPPDPSEPPVQSAPNQSKGKEQTENLWYPWQANFNSVTTIMDAAKIYIPGYFTEELSPEEIAAIEPGMRTEFMQYSGHAGFDGDGKLVGVYLTVTTTIPEANASIAISQDGTVRDYLLDDAPVISTCENVEYKVYQWISVNDHVTLAADASINGYTFAFTLKTSPQNLEQAKEDFTRILQCFAYYTDDKPNLDAITADAIPEWFDNILSYEEALDDPSYGAYMLQTVPSGFSEESIRRYKDQASDYLSGLWGNGYDEIRWKVYKLSGADETRLTNITDKENYDLSLYPIPRASSVPEKLREIVDNPIFFAEELTVDTVWARAYKTGETGDSTGWRMAFSVKYGDVVVEVRTKGVHPEWVYQQLKMLMEE